MTDHTPEQVKLELIGISKSFSGKRAVECQHLPVRKGEFLTLLGPSGSGKTTLLTLIAGFAEPDTGKILVDGLDITHMAPEKRNFGMMFQGYALFPNMSVAENVAFPLAVRRLPRSEIAQRVRTALAQVQLEDYGERLPRQLSGGQQQRVALARATVFNPELLLLDEPLSALDRKLRGEMQTEIKHAHGTLGKTFIYVTHDQEEALSLSDRIVILREGEIIQTGSPSELYEQPKSRFVASFLGQSNFLTGEAVARSGERVDYSMRGKTFTHSGPIVETKAGVILSLRPEKLSLYADEAAASLPNKVAGTIAERSYLGSSVVYKIETAELGSIIVSRPAWGTAFNDAPGQTVWMAWDPTATVSVQE